MGRFNPHSALAYTGIVAVAPVYSMVWAVAKGITLILPKKYYWQLDGWLYSSYQSYIRLYFEVYTGVKFVFHGFEPKEAENALCIMNHQCTTDWFVFDILGSAANAVGRVRFVLKSKLRMLPFYGWYFEQHGCVYVTKSFKKDERLLENAFQKFYRENIPVWLVIYPEGTRHVPALDDDGQVSNAVLTPKHKGFVSCVQNLRNHAAALYDITVAYTCDQNGRRVHDPCMETMMEDKYTEIHVHVKRYEMSNLPQDAGGLTSWLHSRFDEKEKILQSFHRGKGFPDNVWMAKQDRAHVFLHSAFWVGLTTLTLATSTGRRLYKNTVLYGGVGISILSLFYVNYLE
eukprot:m.23352 g.23352  ORF g.23352 m.23352 type:complete len:344 (+) comp7492_c0_seq2:156-1187(+)